MSSKWGDSAFSERETIARSKTGQDTGFNRSPLGVELCDSGKQNMQHDVEPPRNIQQEKPKSRRLMKMEFALEASVTDMNEFQRLVWLGVPSEAPPELRSKIWKIMLGYIPLMKAYRDCHSRKKETEYKELRDMHFEKHGSLISDFYLKQYKQVRLDVLRTNPAGMASIFRHEKIEASMIRVLLLYAIRNPASGYVQGFNDILTPFVIVFLKGILGKSVISVEDLDTLSLDSHLIFESECYWCLSKLLSYVQDNFIFGQPGVIRMVTLLKKIIIRVDAQLFRHLTKEGIDFLHICFRWMSCFLTRELSLYAIIRLWDTYLAEGSNGFSNFHVYVCGVFLLHWSCELTKRDFQDILLFLQSLPTQNWGVSEVESLLAEAFILKTLFDTDGKHGSYK